MVNSASRAVNCEAVNFQFQRSGQRIGTTLHATFEFFDTIAEAKEELKRRGITLCGVEIHPSSEPIQDMHWRGDTCFMLGNEGTGMTDKQVGVRLLLAFTQRLCM